MLELAAGQDSVSSKSLTNNAGFLAATASMDLEIDHGQTNHKPLCLRVLLAVRGIIRSSQNYLLAGMAGQYQNCLRTPATGASSNYQYCVKDTVVPVSRLKPKCNQVKSDNNSIS
jgi:hypothetical protein